MDLLIASHAVSQDMTVVTNDVKHFAYVTGLSVEMWK
jgi:predicted nucleic acid-binding protein